MPTPPIYSSAARKSLPLLWLAACLLLAGCMFKPEPGEGKKKLPDVYPILSEPSAVLEALELAYGARDSVKIKELYDSTYTGQSLDESDGQRIDLTYADEVRHVAALAQEPALFASLELGSSAIWADTLASDDPSHPEWTVVQIAGSSYKIEVTQGETIYGAIGEAGLFQEFAFTPTADPTSPSGRLWKIVRWREKGKSQPDP